MSDPIRFRNALVVLVVLVLAAPAAARPPETAGEEDLFRELRLAVFDGETAAVLDLAERYLRAYPGGTHQTAVRFHRAQALADLPGRRAAAMDAFQTVIPDLDDPILREQAWLGLLRLAAEDAAAGSERGVKLLREALAHRDPPVAVLAGIRISKLEGPPSLRAAAVDRLAILLPQLRDPDLRDEAILAIFRIDPSRMPEERPAGERASGPTMIRLRIEDTCAGGVKVKVNLPLSFFQAVLQSLPEGLDREILALLGEELGRDFSGERIDFSGLLESLEELEGVTPFELQDKCNLIRLWVD